MLSNLVPSPVHMCSNIPQKASEDEGGKSLGITSTPDETPKIARAVVANQISS